MIPQGMWSIDGDPTIARGARVAGSWFGRFLYRYLNFSVAVLMPQAMGDRAALTSHVHRRYAAPLATPDDRVATWTFARSLLRASAWFDSLWADRDRLRHMPMQLLWGMGDPAFGPAYLSCWQSEFPTAETHTFQQSGHFVREEASTDAGPLLRRFLGS